jgi:hypothetical protein
MGTPARAAFASEGATVEVEGERARRIRFNVLEEWFRPDSSAVAQVLGPCLLPLRGLAQNYTLQQSREGEATIIEARANERGKYLRRDQVRAGGAGGERFYAARTRPFWNRPARMRLRVEGGRITRREDFPPDAAPGDKPQQTWTWLYEGGRPTLAQVHDWRGVRSGSWNLKFDGAPAAAEPVDVPASAVVEGDAAPGDETAQAFARGVALARADLFSLAAGEMARAAGLKPRAVAIARAQFEIALATRDAVRARGALEKIVALEGEASPAHALRRARLALFSRDEAALATALQSLPQVLAVGATMDDRLAGADLARAGGQMEAAATILLPLLEGGLPAPLEALAVARLDDLFSPLQPAQRAALAQRITSASTSAQVARALVEGKAAPEIDAAQFSALASLLARRAALEGRDEEAARLWNTVAQSGSESGYFSAQLALAQLGARQKDAASALAAHRAAWPRLDGERAREEWLWAVAGSWLKAANTEVLRTALRSTTARAGAQPSDIEADARLALAVSESSDDDATILAFVRTQATRSRASGGARAAWWQGRLAEELAGAARAATNKPGDRGRTRDRLYDEALRAVEAARVLDPEQEYYAAQKALLSARRVALPEAVVDAGSAVRDRKAAADAAAELVQKFPRSVDARLSAGLAQLTAGQSARAVALLRAALQVLDAPPASTGAANAESQEDDNAPGARVARVTARASLAGALRKAGDRAGAQGLYAALFEGARSSTEQAAFALNWLNVLFEARETAGAAAVISQVARTPWAPSQAQAALAQVLGSVSVRPQWRAAVRESLDAASASGANGGAGADASLRALSEARFWPPPTSTFLRSTPHAAALWPMRPLRPPAATVPKCRPQPPCGAAACRNWNVWQRVAARRSPRRRFRFWRRTRFCAAAPTKPRRSTSAPSNGRPKTPG